MSWSYKITIAYLSFIIMMLSMVYVASKQTNEMQDENYYAKELVYQSVIDAKNNLNALTEKLTITNTSEGIQIKLPTEAASNITEGTIYFLRPSSQKNDFTEKLAVDSNNSQLIPSSKLEEGIYTVKINWKSNDKYYCAEEKIYAQ